MIAFLLKQRTAVKPERLSGENVRWLAFWGNTMEAFFDDWYRYGLAIAVGNIIWYWENER